MNIGTIRPIYSANEQKRLLIQFSVTESVINFTGFAYSESKYKLFEKALDCSQASLIVTDSDIIAFDNLIEKLKDTQTCKTLLVFYNDQAQGVPSLKRIQKAVKKLRSLGIKLQYCKNVESANKWLEKKGYEALSLEKLELPKDTKLIQYKDSRLSIVA